MNKILRIDGLPILNFIDLQHHFNPIDIYNQLTVFMQFADIHCVSLPVQYINEKTGVKYKAEYITKEFWLKLISRVNGIKTLSPKEAFDQIIESEKKNLLSLYHDLDYDAEIEQGFAKETIDARIDYKLMAISQALENEGAKKVLMLLAICEIAEINPELTVLRGIFENMIC